MSVGLPLSTYLLRYFQAKLTDILRHCDYTQERLSDSLPNKAKMFKYVESHCGEKYMHAFSY